MTEHPWALRNEWQAARPIALRSGGFAREGRLRQPLPLRAEVSEATRDTGRLLPFVPRRTLAPGR
jgi:hypothetical protein